METAGRTLGKGLVVDAEPERARPSMRALARAGYRPWLFRDPDIAFASGSGQDLEGAVVAMAGGRARGLAQGLRILRPDLQILAPGEPSWNALEE